MSGFSCNCINEVEKMLAEHNTKLVCTMGFPRDGSPSYLLPKIATEKVERRNRMGPALMLPSFCPFCGIARAAPAEVASNG